MTSFAASKLTGLPGMPQTEAGVHHRAAREGWQFVDVPAACRGGKRREYSLDSLPPETRAALAPQVVKTQVELRAEHLITQRDRARHERRTSLEEGLAAWDSLPQGKRAVAEARNALLDACEAFLKAAGYQPNGTWSKAGVLVFLDDLTAGKFGLREARCQAVTRDKDGLCYATLLRWREARVSGGLPALAPGFRAPNRGASTVTAAVAEYIEGVLHTRPAIQITLLHNLIQARFGRETAPHIASLRRWVKQWKREHKSLLELIENPDAWKRNRMADIGSRSADVQRLNQRWEVDSTKADVLCKDGRHVIVGVVEVYSRRAMLLVTPSSKALAVAALIRNALLAWGVPEEIVSDNGSDFTAQHIVQVLDALEVHQTLCAPFKPEEKPHIESFFKTFNHGLLELRPGYIGHSVADRQGIEARKTFAQRLGEKGDVEMLCTGAELQTFCDQWLDAVYHEDAHSGLDGKRPREVAEAWTGRAVRQIRNQRALDLLLYEAPGDGGWRSVRKMKVRVENREYSAKEFADPTLDRVYVKLDPASLARVCCFRENHQTGRREYLCWAIDHNAPEVDRAEWASRLRAEQKRLHAEAKKELAKRLPKEARENLGEEYLAFRLAERAKVVSLPQPEAPIYTTAALEEFAKAADARDGLWTPELDDWTREFLAEQQAEEIASAAAQRERERRAAPVVELFPAEAEEPDPVRMDDPDRYTWWKELDAKLKAGDEISEQARHFHTHFAKSRYWHTAREVEADLALG